MHPITGFPSYLFTSSFPDKWQRSYLQSQIPPIHPAHHYQHNFVKDKADHITSNLEPHNFHCLQQSLEQTLDLTEMFKQNTICKMKIVLWTYGDSQARFTRTFMISPLPTLQQHLLTIQNQWGLKDKFKDSRTNLPAFQSLPPPSCTKLGTLFHHSVFGFPY